MFTINAENFERDHGINLSNRQSAKFVDRSHPKFHQKIVKALTAEFQSKSNSNESRYYCVFNENLAVDLQKIEVNHRQDNKRCMKVALVYSKDEQPTAQHMFANGNLPVCCVTSLCAV